MSDYRQVTHGVDHAALSHSSPIHQPTSFKTYSNSSTQERVQSEEMVTTLKLG